MNKLLVLAQNEHFQRIGMNVLTFLALSGGILMASAALLGISFLFGFFSTPPRP